jgi:CDP-alcohol phosphatidyltransferase-like enzyme
MPEETAQISSAVESTYKAREAEGILDLYFYRKVGFRLAQFFARLGMTPVGVTLLGGVFGILAGHLYYYRDLRTNIIGMAFHVFANALDNADGQLARMTGKGGREGRIIDSLVDHIIFVNIYLHLMLRCLAEGASPAVCLLALSAGISHAMQGAAADYFRNAYLYFVNGRSQAQLDSTTSLLSDYRALIWRRQPWKKFLIATYLNFTRQQELLAPSLNRLRLATDRQFPDEIPGWLKARYRDWARPMFKWWGFLMTNTRMLILFFLLFIDQSVWFFWVELTILNALLVWLVVRQANMFKSLLEAATTWQQSEAAG